MYFELPLEEEVKAETVVEVEAINQMAQKDKDLTAVRSRLTENIRPWRRPRRPRRRPRRRRRRVIANDGPPGEGYALDDGSTS